MLFVVVGGGFGWSNDVIITTGRILGHVHVETGGLSWWIVVILRLGDGGQRYGTSQRLSIHSVCVCVYVISRKSGLVDGDYLTAFGVRR